MKHVPEMTMKITGKTKGIYIGKSRYKAFKSIIRLNHRIRQQKKKLLNASLGLHSF